MTTTQADDVGVDQALSEWARAFAAGDVAALVALVTPDAEFWTQGAPPLVGHEAVARTLEDFFGRFRAVQRFTELERFVASDWAIVRGEERNTLTPKDGGAPIEHRQRAFSLLRRGPDDRWRFARGMTNQGPVAPETKGRA